MTGIIIIVVVLLLTIMNVSYALTPEEIVKMKEAGISDEVILKMIEKESAEKEKIKVSESSSPSYSNPSQKTSGTSFKIHFKGTQFLEKTYVIFVDGKEKARYHDLEASEYTEFRVPAGFKKTIGVFDHYSPEIQMTPGVYSIKLYYYSGGRIEKNLRSVKFNEGDDKILVLEVSPKEFSKFYELKVNNNQLPKINEEIKLTKEDASPSYSSSSQGSGASFKIHFKGDAILGKTYVIFVDEKEEARYHDLYPKKHTSYTLGLNRRTFGVFNHYSPDISIKPGTYNIKLRYYMDGNRAEKCIENVEFRDGDNKILVLLLFVRKLNEFYELKQ